MELETAGKEAGEVAKAALHLKKGKDEYQKVYNKIADMLEVDDYDGSLRALQGCLLSSRC